VTDVSHDLILAACDGADRGREAVAFARLLAERTGAPLLLAAVHPYPGLPYPPPFGPGSDEHRAVEHAIRALRDELAPSARAVAVPGFSPAHAICALAEARGAGTIVVGSRRHAHGPMADADHALQVLRSAHADVVVVPDDRAADALERIVVGFDGGAGAHDALDRAVALARATGARLHVVSAIAREANAWWIAGDALADPDTLARWEEDRRSSLLEDIREALAEAGDVPWTHEVVTGAAAPELIAAGEDADLLVLGSRRWGRLARLVLGSVSEPVARARVCPTLVVARRREEPAPSAELAAGTAQA
jgi:nucleotide-binding universal stress UspA family protein